MFRVIPEPSTQVNALLAGEVDVLRRVSLPDAACLRGRGVTVVELKSAPGGSNAVMTLSFTLDRPATGALAFREAVALGLDRQAILDRVAFSAGRVAAAPISSGIA